jgi:hypothetical protein
MTTEQQANALRVRLDPVALAADGEQAGRHGNALLDTAAAIVARVMAGGGFALARPVSASFRDDVRGSTGIEVAVNLANPGDAGAATVALHEHFGVDGGGVDVIRVT